MPEAVPPPPAAAMDRRAIFARYVEQRRCIDLPGFHRESFPFFTRYTPKTKAAGLTGCVVFVRIPAVRADAIIAEQVQHFRNVGCSFEWKVYDLDEPGDITLRLLRHGFTPQDREAFMVYPAKSFAPLRSAAPNIAIQPINSPPGIRDVVDVQETVWGRPFPWLMGALADPGADRFTACAYDGPTPVGTGWMDFVPDSDFADLHGGAVLPGYRGHGIYSALFAARVREAQRRNVAYLAVDAAPMSRPILERKGFRWICDTTPFELGAR